MRSRLALAFLFALRIGLGLDFDFALQLRNLRIARGEQRLELLNLPQYWTIICDPGGMPGGTWTIMLCMVA